MEGLTAVEFQNANLAYRFAMEGIRDDCTRQVIDRWEDPLSIVDLWADSHCETILVYSYTINPHTMQQDGQFARDGSGIEL